MGAERIKGYEAREIVGRHFSIFYPATDVATGKPDSELEIAARVGRYEDEGWRLRKDGSRFWDLTERRAAELRYRVLVERGE
jgi:PAS domain S-box-containing protein